MNIRKAFIFLLAVVMLTVTACGQSQAPAPTAAPPAATTTAAAATTAAAGTTAPATTTTAEATTTAAPAADQKVLRVTVGGEGAIFDPQFNSGLDSSNYMAQMFEGLLYYEPDGVLANGAASAYNISDDGLVWTFEIRSDAKWSDGKKLVAGDFLYSFTRLVDPEVNSSNAQTLGGFIKNGIEVSEGDLPLDQFGVEAPDDSTFIVTLEAPCSFFDDMLTHSSFYPLRSDVAVDGDEGRWSRSLSTCIVNGPYKMTAYDEYTGFRLERNEHYYNANRQKPDAIEFKFMINENSAMAAFETGDLDFSTLIPSEEIPRLDAAGLYRSFPRLGTYYLLIQQEIEPYDNVNVRKALSYAVDPVYMATSVLNNRFIPAQSFIGPGYTGSAIGIDFYDESGPLIDRSNYAANVELAQQYMAEAGYPNGEGFPVMEYMYNDTVDNRIIAEALQAFWQENLNITVTISGIEGAAMGEIRGRGDFTVTRLGWLSDYNDALDMMSIFTTGSSINLGNYFNKDFDDKFRQAQLTSDRAARIKLVHEMERLLLVEDMGTIPLFHYLHQMLYDPAKISGIYTAPAGQLHLTQVIIN